MSAEGHMKHQKQKYKTLTSCYILEIKCQGELGNIAKDIQRCIENELLDVESVNVVPVPCHTQIKFHPNGK
jgi:hypothetical protein